MVACFYVSLNQRFHCTVTSIVPLNLTGLRLHSTTTSLLSSCSNVRYLARPLTTVRGSVGGGGGGGGGGDNSN